MTTSEPAATITPETGDALVRDLRRYKWTLQYCAFILTLVLLLQVVDALDWSLR